mmetsp:Transcript_40306/g.126872  ORF Transcript_40306/g.126872 Transcript_40306/m.126872 type:complete len:296 (+) Transcript_40306:1082-1969(+)
MQRLVRPHLTEVCDPLALQWDRELHVGPTILQPIKYIGVLQDPADTARQLDDLFRYWVSKAPAQSLREQGLNRLVLAKMLSSVPCMRSMNHVVQEKIEQCSQSSQDAKNDQNHVTYGYALCFLHQSLGLQLIRKRVVKCDLRGYDTDVQARCTEGVFKCATLDVGTEFLTEERQLIFKRGKQTNLQHRYAPAVGNRNIRRVAALGSTSSWVRYRDLASCWRFRGEFPSSTCWCIGPPELYTRSRDTESISNRGDDLVLVLHLSFADAVCVQNNPISLCDVEDGQDNVQMRLSLLA